VDYGAVRERKSSQSGAAAYEGEYSLAINAGDIGLISTNINTVSGKLYTLNFAYAANPGAPFIGTTSGVSVVIGGSYVGSGTIQGGDWLGPVVADYTNSFANLDWRTASFKFRALESSTRLGFHSYLGYGNAGLFMDTVSLVQGSEDLYYLPEEP